MRRLLGLALLAAAPAVHAADASAYLGRWDVTLETPEREYASWLEIARRDGALGVRMVGRWGHARWLPRAEVSDDGIRFVSPKEEEGRTDDMVFEGRLDGQRLVGETRGPDGTVWKWRGDRAPELKPAAAPVWGKPVTLFNGRDLHGWHSSDPKAAATWRVEKGALVSLGRGAELVSDARFQDFKLHVEFKVEPGSNSGIYLRGRYEVQVENDAVPDAPERALGSVYGFLAPSVAPDRAPGKWRSYDITLVGRHVTVVLDGVTLIENREIPGITGGALDSREGTPGPFYLQGSENGRVEYRNIVVTPAAPTVWPLRDVQRIGGHATEIVGAPRVAGSGAKAAIVFDGKGDGLFVPANPLAGWPAFTIEVRFKPDGTGGEEQRFLHLEDALKHRVLVETRVRDKQWSLDTFLFQDADHRLTLLDRAKTHPTDRWYWVALVYDGRKMAHYVDGVLELEGEVAFAPMTQGRTSLGVRQNRVSWFKGAIGEVRFTPAVLSATQLRAESTGVSRPR